MPNLQERIEKDNNFVTQWCKGQPYTLIWRWMGSMPGGQNTIMNFVKQLEKERDAAMNVQSKGKLKPLVNAADAFALARDANDRYACRIRLLKHGFDRHYYHDQYILGKYKGID